MTSTETECVVEGGAWAARVVSGAEEDWLVGTHIGGRGRRSEVGVAYECCGGRVVGRRKKHCTFAHIWIG